MWLHHSLSIGRYFLVLNSSLGDSRPASPVEQQVKSKQQHLIISDEHALQIKQTSNTWHCCKRIQPPPCTNVCLQQLSVKHCHCISISMNRTEHLEKPLHIKALLKLSTPHTEDSNVSADGTYNRSTTSKTDMRRVVKLRYKPYLT